MKHPTDFDPLYPQQDPPANKVFVIGLIAWALFAVLWILGAL